MFVIGVERKHDAKWLFHQEKATFHCSKKVCVYSENALATTAKEAYNGRRFLLQAHRQAVQSPAGRLCCLLESNLCRRPANRLSTTSTAPTGSAWALRPTPCADACTPRAWSPTSSIATSTTPTFAPSTAPSAPFTGRSQNPA